MMMIALLIILLLKDGIISCDDVDATNFFEKYFYFSEKFHERYKYSYKYNSEGIVNSVNITI